MKGRKLKVTVNAPVVLGFVLICFIATLLGMVSGGTITKQIFMVYHSSAANPLTYVRMITHVFGHHGWEHFIGNATYLLLLGPILEEKYGSRTMAEIIFITALIVGIVNYLLFRDVALCGASSVVFSFIILTSFTGFHKGEIPLSFLLVVLVFFGQQVVESFTSTDQISYMAHFVGGLVGGVLGYLLNQKKDH